MRRLMLGGAGAALLAAAMAACGGGGSNAIAPAAGPPIAAPTAGAAATDTGKAVLTIPNRAPASSGRSKQFVSASAVSVGMAINGGAAAFSDISATSTLCAAVSGGRTCTIPVNAPPGNDTFVVTLYDAPNGTGHVLGTSTATQTIALGTPFTLAFAASGVVASIAVSVPAISVGPTSVPVTVTAKDAAGNTIVGADPYAVPITLSNSDATGTLTLSATTVNTPNDAVTLTYSGGALPAAATISATATGVPPSAITPASVLPLNYFPVGLSRIYARTTSNSYGSYSLASPSPQPSSTPYVTTGSFTQSITGGGSFNNLTNLQSTISTGGGIYATGYFGGFNDEFRSVAGGLVSIVGGTSSINSISQTTIYPAGLVYAALPLVPGATQTGISNYIETDTSSTGTMQTFTRNAANNYSFSTTYADGSTFSDAENNDGSALLTYGAGTTCANEAWDNGMSCAMTAAMKTVAAPANGSIVVTVSQTTSSGTTSNSITVPVSLVYPNGVPLAGTSIASTIGTTPASLPAACAVSATYASPVVPITIVYTFWYPGSEEYAVDTENDYLAPGIGPVCITYAQAVTGVDLPSALSATLSPPQTAYTSAYTEVDALTSVGPPLQTGTITASGHGRTRASLPGPLRERTR